MTSGERIGAVMAHPHYTTLIMAMG